MKAGFQPVMFDPTTVRRQRCPVEEDQPVEISSGIWNADISLGGVGAFVGVDFDVGRGSNPGVEASVLLGTSMIWTASDTLHIEGREEPEEPFSATENIYASSTVFSAIEVVSNSFQAISAAINLHTPATGSYAADAMVIINMMPLPDAATLANSDFHHAAMTTSI